MGVLVLITGTGRSGTSTMSGTFHHLGLHVPGPYLGANESNPKGFFESKWAVAFHKEITSAAHLHDFDSRPAAFERARAAWTPERRRRLTAFLVEQSARSDQVVVKDPRSVWAQGLWREAAAEAGLETRYVSMLRHPAEVVGSRATYYASSTDEEQRHRYETFNVARWINSSVLSERETRGHARSFVRYTDLLTDWRPVLTTIGVDLGLRYDPDPATGGTSPVDDFIDPGLRRHQVTWDELQIPAELQDVAQRIWDSLEVLADTHGEDTAASAGLSAQGEQYARLFADAAAISHDATEEARDEARRAGARAAREKAAAATGATVATGAERAARAGATQARASVAPPSAADAGGRELVRLLARRVRSRLRRGRS